MRPARLQGSLRRRRRRAARSARRQANNSLADGRPNAGLCDDKHGSGNRSGSGGCAAHASGNRIELCLGRRQAAVLEVQSLVDKAVADRRAGCSANTDVEAARSGLRRAQEYLAQRTDELRRIAADAPLPTVAEGQLNVGRSELSASWAALEKLTIRAPIDGSVLQVNARPGELISFDGDAAHPARRHLGAACPCRSGRARH